MTETLRIGISMRETQARDVYDPKDSLSQDWPVFMAAHFPDALWLPVPNLGEAVGDFATQWGLTSVILSGGNDIGSAPLRDETESALLTWAIGRQVPVFGVCRGMEMIQHYFGGKLTRCKPDHDTDRLHDIRWLDTDVRYQVNSYHQWGIERTNLVPPLLPLAVSEDGMIEALQHTDLPILGVQWHPERQNSPTDLDLLLMRALFTTDPVATPRPVAYS